MIQSQSLQTLVKIADLLDSKGFYQEANILDAIILTQYAISGPKKVKEYYEKCIDKGQGDKEYCARVAWSIYCAHVNPGYKGCTEYGRKWGRPYSAPISKKKTKKTKKASDVNVPCPSCGSERYHTPGCPKALEERDKQVQDLGKEWKGEYEGLGKEWRGKYEGIS